MSWFFQENTEFLLISYKLCITYSNLQVNYIFVFHIWCTLMTLVFDLRKVQIPTTINFTDFSATISIATGCRQQPQ